MATGFKALLKPTVLLRRLAMQRGLFGGDRFWLGVGGAMWLAKTMRKMVSGGEPTPRFIEELKPGQRLVITNPEPVSKPSRKEKKAARKAAKL